MKNNQSGFSAIEAVLILVIVGIIGGTGYYIYSSQKSAEVTQDNTTSTIREKSEDKEATTPPPAAVDKSEATKKAIDAAFDAGNYASVEALMEATVSYSRQSSDTGNTHASKAEATQQFASFGSIGGSEPAETPWDFDVMTTDPDFAARIKAANNPAFDNAFIGLSEDKGFFIAFKFSESGLVSEFWYGFAELV